MGHILLNNKYRGSSMNRRSSSTLPVTLINSRGIPHRRAAADGP
jgi:hypothetical protein